LARIDRVVRTPHPLAVDLEDRQVPRPRARRDDDVLRLERTLPIPSGDRDLARAREPTPPLHVLHAVLLEQVGHAPRALVRDLPTPLRGNAQVQLDFARLDPEVPETRDLARVMRALEQRLRGDAPPVVADPAELVRRLDAGRHDPELRGPDSGHVDDRTPADPDHIVRTLRHAPL